MIDGFLPSSGSKNCYQFAKVQQKRQTRNTFAVIVVYLTEFNPTATAVAKWVMVENISAL
ncbi:MAG: hypothetical protein IJU62_09670 [Muribaculaceae bacterium]|nr:hypothetical protein [Muribaculaceae bacterium]